jgi:hypothetical protein
MVFIFVRRDFAIHLGQRQCSDHDLLGCFCCRAEKCWTVRPSHLQCGWDDEPLSRVVRVRRQLVHKVVLLAGLDDHSPKPIREVDFRPSYLPGTWVFELK